MTKHYQTLSLKAAAPGIRLPFPGFDGRHGCPERMPDTPAHAYDIRATWQLYDTEDQLGDPHPERWAADRLAHQANRASLAVVASLMPTRTRPTSPTSEAVRTRRSHRLGLLDSHPLGTPQPAHPKDRPGGRYRGLVAGLWSHRWRGQPLLRSEHRGDAHHRRRGLVFRRAHHRAAGVRLDHDSHRGHQAGQALSPAPGRPVPPVMVTPTPARH